MHTPVNTSDHLAGLEASARDAVSVADIAAARAVLAGQVLVTDCAYTRTLSQILGCDIWLKFENLQFTSSFKERGALNRLQALSDTERKNGVIAMSAGNHAQGVAYHAARLGIATTIVMPIGTPQVKIDNTRRFGARVIVAGETLEDSYQHALDACHADSLTFIHPYDDPLVIAGQGTIGSEMLAAVPELDTLVVPIGGGGLISGIAIAAKAIKPEITVIGVEAELVPSMYNAVKSTDLPMRTDTLAEGIAVKAPGRLTRPLIHKYVDDIVLVSESMLERAVSWLISIEKTVVEGAGAAGLAAIIGDRARFAGRKVGLVLCGGNIDTRLLASVLMRDLAREGRISQLTIDIVDRPGQLAKVADVLGQAEANIVEVLHQRVFSELPAKGTLLEVVIETRDRGHLNDVITTLEQAGFGVTLQSNPGGAH